jgi:TfoX/Sxy family transcriptional regulator of competence genes
MTYDTGLEQRIREQLQDRDDVVEKKMFGGLCFMVSGNMACGIVKDSLMARVGPEQYEECLLKPFSSEMDFTGRPMKGMVYVNPNGIESDKDLKKWIDFCINFVETLAAK